MTGIARRFGSVPALRGADFVLAPGQVQALLGENGAGKTTLMRVLFGLERQDTGSVEVFGRPLPPGSPREAMNAGIGMVHQHFSQVPRMTVAENVGLGRSGWRFDRAAAAAAVLHVGAETGLALDPQAKAEDLSAGLRQRLEIVKALAREVRILILDEPTAVLTPGEVDELFGALRHLVAGGLSVVLITHKLREVAAIADRVTVLRRGEVVASGPAREFSAEALAAAMVGEGAGPALVAAVRDGHEAAPALPLKRPEPALQLRDVTVRPGGGRLVAVRGVSLDVEAGEIVAVAAVEGNGQRELMRAVAGLVPYQGTCHVGHDGEVGFVPEDRQHEGLILEFSLAENLALGGHHRFWLDHRFLEHHAANLIDEFGIRTAGGSQPVAALSGGNQQRVVLARVLSQLPTLLVAENPTRGLDIRATADVHARIRRAARERGLGVLYYSTDLDEVLAIGDRIGVMAGGQWRWADEPRTREHIGAMMLGVAAQ